jgi:hypothetical protein
MNSILTALERLDEGTQDDRAAATKARMQYHELRQLLDQQTAILTRWSQLTLDTIASAMYAAAPWADPEFTGKPRRAWRIDGVPWDTDSDVQLCEHERDDYRTLARAATNLILQCITPPPGTTP